MFYSQLIDYLVKHKSASVWSVFMSNIVLKIKLLYLPAHLNLKKRWNVEK